MVEISEEPLSNQTLEHRKKAPPPLQHQNWTPEVPEYKTPVSLTSPHKVNLASFICGIVLDFLFFMSFYLHLNQKNSILKDSYLLYSDCIQVDNGDVQSD